MTLGKVLKNCDFSNSGFSYKLSRYTNTDSWGSPAKNSDCREQEHVRHLEYAYLYSLFAALALEDAFRRPSIRNKICR